MVRWIKLFGIGLTVLYTAVLAGQPVWNGSSVWEKQGSYKAIALDKLAQAYLIDGYGEVAKYSPEGTFIGRFSRKDLGMPGAIDVSDPLQVLLWYPDFQSIIFLERLMTPYHTLRLDPGAFPQPAVVALDRGNQVWVYDRFLHTLFRLDQQGKPQGESQDLSLITTPPQAPTMLVADANGVYLADPSTGIWVFNRLGQYQFTWPVRDVDFIQCLPDGVLLIRQKEQFSILSGNRFSAPVLLELPFPGTLLYIQGKHVLVGTSDRVYLFPRE